MGWPGLKGAEFIALHIGSGVVGLRQKTEAGCNAFLLTCFGHPTLMPSGSPTFSSRVRDPPLLIGGFFILGVAMLSQIGIIPVLDQRNGETK